MDERLKVSPLVHASCNASSGSSHGNLCGQAFITTSQTLLSPSPMS